MALMVRLTIVMASRLNLVRRTAGNDLIQLLSDIAPASFLWEWDIRCGILQNVDQDHDGGQHAHGVQVNDVRLLHDRHLLCGKVSILKFAVRLSVSASLGGVSVGGVAAGGEVGDDEGGGDDQHFDFLSFVGVCSVTHFLALL